MREDLIVYTDGGARGNPGPAAIGIFITDEAGREVARFGKTIGQATNNVAEYRAVIEALTWIKNNLKLKVQPYRWAGESTKFFLDSSLVVNQLNGIFKIKEKHLRDLVVQIRELEREVEGNISYNFVSREKNKIADQLVNQSLDTLINKIAS